MSGCGGWPNDLQRPPFSISLTEAMSRRLRRNYFWMFFVLLAAWLLKTASAKLQAGGRDAVFVHSLSAAQQCRARFLPCRRFLYLGHLCHLTTCAGRG